MTYPPGTLPVNRQNATPTKNTHPNDHNSQAAAINAIVQLIGGSGVRGPFEAGGQLFTTLEDLFQHLWDANKAVASQLDAVQGTDKLLHGSGAPSAGTGSKGDVYINTSAWAVYGPKSTSGWGDPASMVGPRGKEGPQGGVGSAGRDGTDGADGAPGKDGKDGAIAWVRKAGELGYSRSTVEVSGGGVTVTDDEEADLVRIDFAAVSGLPDHTSGDTRKILRLSPGPTVLPGWEDLPEAPAVSAVHDFVAPLQVGDYHDATFSPFMYMSRQDGAIYATGRTEFSYLYVPEDTVFDRVGVFKTAGSGTATVRVGLYKLNPHASAVNDVLQHRVTWGDISIASGTGMYEMTISEALTAGWYATAASLISYSGSVSVRGVSSSVSSLVSPLVRAARHPFNLNTLRYPAIAVNAVFPTDFTSLTFVLPAGPYVILPQLRKAS